MKDSNKMLTKEEFRTAIAEVEKNIINMDNSYVGKETEIICPLKHSFGDGCYIREIFNPKGALIVTKIHKKTHPFFLLEGSLMIATGKGVEVIKAPYQGMTKAGTKRAIYALEDVKFITVHVTDKTDLDEIEKEIISKNFKEFDEIPKGEEVKSCPG